jgi:hypothetical protein
MPRCADQELKVHDFTEEDTVRLAQRGNAAAFEQLYRRYSARVYALCLRGNTDQAINWLDKSYD